MNPSDSSTTGKEREIFAAAAALPPAERTAYLDAACAGFGKMRARIDEWLRRHDESGFMEAVENEAAFARLKPEEVGEWIGPYKLMEQIGQGGFGTVWVADQDRPVRRRVALKILKMGMDTKEVIARFEQERQALAMMDHPHIAKVFDAGATQWGRPFFVMELVRGIKITDYCDQANLPTAERLALFIQVCQAVQHAHQKGIIHRDLKPSNILVTLHDGVPVPKVIDFGVAKATQQQRLTDLTVYTQFEQMIGTPLYMSPEQAEMSGLDIDTRSDIYSLGVLLYELLTGRTPFDPEELMKQGLDEIRRTIREQEPLTPSMFVRTMEGAARMRTAQRRQTESGKLIALLRGDLDWIVMKALEKDRTRRYETANGLALDIKRHLASEPVLARPPSALYRFRRMLRRNKLAFGAAALVLTALLAGAAFSTWSFLREQEQRRRTALQERLARQFNYAADMNRVSKALSAQNLGRARRLLDLHWPAPGEQDLRGWEWRYLWEQCRNHGVSVFTRHTTGASSVSFSREGRWLAIGYFDGRVELWEAGAHRLARVLQEKARGHACVAFSPTSDVLAATGEAEIVKWHDLATGAEKIAAQAPGPVRDLAFSHDGAQLAILTSGPDRVLLVPDAAAGDAAAVRTLSLPPGGGYFMNNVRLSPDAARLYVSCGAAQRPEVRCLALPGGEIVWPKTAAPRKSSRALTGFSAMALSPDGRLLVTGTAFSSGLLKVWDAQTGEALETLEGHTGWVCQLAFSPDGRRLASASTDQSVRLWDTTTWTAAAEPLRGNGDEVHSLAFSPDGSRLVTGSKDGVVMLWDLAARRAIGRSALPAQMHRVRALPGGREVVARSEGGQLVRFDLENGRETALWAGSGQRASFTSPNFLGLYDGTDRLEVHEIGPAATRSLGVARVGPAFQFPFVYAPATRQVAWRESGRVMRLIRLGEEGAPIELQADDGLLDVSVRFSADGKYLLAAEKGGAPHIWEVATRRRVPAAERYLSPHGFALASYNSMRGTGLFAWLNAAVAPATVPRPKALEGPAPKGWWPREPWRDRAFSPDGHTFAVASGYGMAGLYDVARPGWRALLHGHRQAVNGVAFSPDGKRLATTGDGDEAVKLWDVETQQELLTLSCPGTFFDGVEFTDDGSRLLIGSDGKPGTWHCWHAPSLAEIELVERNGGAWARGE